MNKPHEPRLARVAAIVADPARSRMLAYLLSGEYASASELAKTASVTPATASGHLAKLLDAGFVVCEPRGRHRYYRLADVDVAHALEALALVAERDEHDRAWGHPERKRLRFARCCYGHLAGQLAVTVFDALQRNERLKSATDGYETDRSGKRVAPRIGDDSGFAEWTTPIRLPLPGLVRTPRSLGGPAGRRDLPTLHQGGMAAPCCRSFRGTDHQRPAGIAPSPERRYPLIPRQSPRGFADPNGRRWPRIRLAPLRFVLWRRIDRRFLACFRRPH